MPESLNGHESEVELDPKEIEKIAERIASDIESAVACFLKEEPLGGELIIELEANSNPGVIPENQLVTIINEKLVEKAISCQIVSISARENTVSLLLEVAGSEEKEPAVETVRLTFSNKCAYCGATVSIEADVPANSHEKVKKGKDGPYQDWNYGLQDCTCTSEDGTPRKVFVFFRQKLPKIS